jgi:4-oxalocrotonate tautomerase family enzyme
MISNIDFRILLDMSYFGKYAMPTVFVYWYAGRNAEQKQKIAARITDALVEDGNASRESILIIFQEITPDNTARAGHLQSIPLVAEDNPKAEN